MGQYMKKKRIYDEGMFYAMKSFGTKLLGQTTKKAVTKGSEHDANKAIDKLFQLDEKEEENGANASSNRRQTIYRIWNKWKNKSVAKWWETENYVIYYYNMPNFCNPKCLERYEDLVFNLEQATVTNVVNNAHQKKDGYRFVHDNSGEVTPFDWYNVQFSVLSKLTN